MKFTLRTPCVDCPFRSDVRFFLRKGRFAEIIHSMLRDEATFPCHLTLTRDEDGERTCLENEVHCAGVLILLKKTDHLFDSLSIRLAVFAGWFDPGGLDMTAPVLDRLEDYIENERG